MKKVLLIGFLFVNIATFSQETISSDDESLKSYLNYLEESWHDVPNPIIATYEGNAFGDYFHIEFVDSVENYYDFGDGDNDFGKYKLFEEGGHYEDNPKYIGKQFEVYWEWKVSEFSCCDGNYNLAKEKIPSITRLELID